MSHPNERTIERIAMALLDLGTAESWGRNSAVPAELVDSFGHVCGCAHCREILEVLIQTEAAWRRAEKSDVRVISLRPLLTTTVALDDGHADEEDEDEFPVAAAHSASRPEQSRVLTLITDDDRYYVRIFPDDEGVGAKAVLVLAAQETPQPEEARPALRVSGIEYEFDEAGIARLPHFPGEDVALVLQ